MLVQASFWWWAGDADQWKPLQATAKAGQVWTRVTATPVGWSFNPGNGEQPTTCAGPGTTWQPSDGLWKPSPAGCSYRYPHTSYDQPQEKFTATFTMRWAITWQASDGSTGTLPTITRTTTHAFPVGEAQTLVTR